MMFERYVLDKGVEIQDVKLENKLRGIVVIDEIEKAHKVVHNFFLNVFQDGYFQKSDGRWCDMRNVVFVITSNVAAKEVKEDQIEASYASFGDHIVKEFRSSIDNEPFLQRIDWFFAMAKLTHKEMGELEQTLKLEAAYYLCQRRGVHTYWLPTPLKPSLGEEARTLRRAVNDCFDMDMERDVSPGSSVFVTIQERKPSYHVNNVFIHIGGGEGRSHPNDDSPFIDEEDDDEDDMYFAEGEESRSSGGASHRKGEPSMPRRKSKRTSDSTTSAEPEPELQRETESAIKEETTTEGEESWLSWFLEWVWPGESFFTEELVHVATVVGGLFALATLYFAYTYGFPVMFLFYLFKPVLLSFGVLMGTWFLARTIRYVSSWLHLLILVALFTRYHNLWLPKLKEGLSRYLNHVQKTREAEALHQD